MKSHESHDCVPTTAAAPATNVHYLASRWARRSPSLSLMAEAPSHVRLAGPATSPGGFEFNALPDSVLLSWLTGTAHRPNVLIECAAASVNTAMRHVMTWCQLPFRFCALPGALELPSTTGGTLLLKDVSALTLSQQVRLYDWLTVAHGQVQVVSLTSRPLSALVDDGEFLEGLLYRLNVIRLDGLAGTRPAPLDAWRPVSEPVS